MTITTTTNLVLPFWQIVALIALTWVAMVAYRFIEGEIAAVMLRRVKDACSTRRDVARDRHRNSDGSCDRNDSLDSFHMSDFQEGKW